MLVTSTLVYALPSLRHFFWHCSGIHKIIFFSHRSHHLKLNILIKILQFYLIETKDHFPLLKNHIAHPQSKNEFSNRYRFKQRNNELNNIEFNMHLLEVQFYFIWTSRIKLTRGGRDTAYRRYLLYCLLVGLVLA